MNKIRIKKRRNVKIKTFKDNKRKRTNFKINYLDSNDIENINLIIHVLTFINEIDQKHIVNRNKFVLKFYKEITFEMNLLNHFIVFNVINVLLKIV